MAISPEISPLGERLVRLAEDETAVATPWQIIRWKFMRHRVAVFSLGVLAVFYLCALFAEFVAPYSPRHYDTNYMFMPPQTIRFSDNGQLQLRPFVYGMVGTLDPKTFKTTYVVDENQKYPIHLLVRGDPYVMFWIIKSDLHLFGVNEGTLFLFGTDKMGAISCLASSSAAVFRCPWACWASPSASSSVSWWGGFRVISAARST